MSPNALSNIVTLTATGGAQMSAFEESFGGGSSKSKDKDDNGGDDALPEFPFDVNSNLIVSYDGSIFGTQLGGSKPHMCTTQLVTRRLAQAPMGLQHSQGSCPHPASPSLRV